MTNPERTIEEKLKSFKYTESDIKLILGIVSPILEAERQKRDEMVEEIVSTLKIARNYAKDNSTSSYGKGIYEGLCHAVSLIDNGIKLTQLNNPK